MPTLSEYTNVYKTALTVIRKKGFRTWYDDKTDLFCAEKDGWDFCAYSPCGLLGVISIYEHVNPSEYKEYWWRLNDGEELSHSKPEYVSVMKKI